MDVAAQVKKDLDAQVLLMKGIPGQKIKVHTGRDWLSDAYQNGLVLVLKLKAALLERDGA